MIWLFLLHLAVTLFMTGVIWMVQVVHYPLFARVGTAVFPAYEVAHSGLMTLVVLPPMLIEAVLALLFAFAPPTTEVPTWVWWLGLILVGVLWGATFFVQVPQHNLLAMGFDVSVHEALVQGNWLRTAVWSARSLLLLWILAQMLKATS